MMNRWLRSLVSIPIVILLGAAAPPQKCPPAASITPQDAARCDGQVKTVCGKVVSGKYVRTGSRPTLLNLDEPYPHQIFTIMISEENRSKFPSPPEKAFKGRRVCVQGKITSYNGKQGPQPEIVVDQPSQIQVVQKH
jgi:hypothetical protein